MMFNLNALEKLAWRGVPDLRTAWVDGLSHRALVALGAEQWTQKIDGHRVQRYALRGQKSVAPDAPAVLLVHGLNGSSSSMFQLARDLTSVSPRLALFDLPGHGRSPLEENERFTIGELARTTLAVAEDLHRETGKKIVLIGNSLGGALAFFAASQKPEIIAGVVGLNPAGAEVADGAVAQLPQKFADENAGARRMAELLFKKTPLLFWLIGRDVARGWESAPVQRILADVREGRHKQLTSARITDLRVPLYILWGADDRLLPQASVEEFRAIPGAKVELLPGCGHMPQLEQPAVTAAKVREFIAKL